MTFLAPSTLIFLSALLVPIIIHFLNRISEKKIKFSTIWFIKKLENSAIRNVQLKKIILLFIRLAILTALVIMFARPVTQGFMPGWLSAELDSRLVLIIDNSSSMKARINNESLIDIAKKTAKSVIQIFNKRTTLDIIQTCPPEILFSGNVNDPMATIIIDEIIPSFEYDNLWVVADSLIRVIQSTEVNKECVIISDFQNKDIPNDISLSNGWKSYFVNTGKIHKNLGINDLDIISRIKVPGQLLKLKTNIKNSGQEKILNTPVNLLFNNDRVGQVISDFNKEAQKEFIFQAYPIKKGMLEAKITLPYDDYTEDNIRYFTAPILDKINCVIIGGSHEDISMFELVINAIDPNKQLIELESIVQPVINRLFIDNIDILIIHDIDAITKFAFDELDNFLRNGGGLIWFSGGMETNPSYEKYFSNLSFPKAKMLIESGTGFFDVNITSEINNILSDLNIRRLEKEFPECYRYIKHIHSKDHIIHLKLNNGDPFLLEFNRGSGRVFYFSSLMDLSWNDMPIRGLLVPLMHKLLILGGTDEMNTSPIMVGSKKVIYLDQNEVRDKWEVKSPKDDQYLIVPDFNKESISIDKTNQLGVYDILKNGKLYSSFSTFLHPSEYIVDKISNRHILTAFSSDDFKWLEIDKNFIGSFKNTRHGKSLWKIFLLIVLILFLLETWVGRPIPKNIKNLD